MSHTPGPWRVSAINDEEFDIVGPKHDAEHGDYDFICTVNGNWSSETGELELESPANARLIAAAPDLLAALEPFAYLADVLEEGQYLTHHGVYISDQQAKAAATALAAAKGDQP